MNFIFFSALVLIMVFADSLLRAFIDDGAVYLTGFIISFALLYSTKWLNFYDNETMISIGFFMALYLSYYYRKRLGLGFSKDLRTIISMATPVLISLFLAIEYKYSIEDALKYSVIFPATLGLFYVIREKDEDKKDRSKEEDKVIQSG